MQNIKYSELKNIVGGATINGTLITSIYKICDFIFELGRSLGSARRRVDENKMCPL